METLLRDLRLALRAAGRSPGFAVLAVLTLALGLAAATAVFAMVDAVLLRRLPFRDQGALVSVWSSQPWRQQPKVEISLAEHKLWSRRSRSFDGLATLLASDLDIALTGAGEPLHLRSRLVSTDFFEVLGARPEAGRTLRPADALPAKSRAVVISDRLRRQLTAATGHDPLGGIVTLDAEPCRVVGAMPPAFRFPAEVDVWTPIPTTSSDSPRLRLLQEIGRLRPGVTLDAARAELDRLSLRDPSTARDARETRAVILPLADELLGDTPAALRLLATGAGLLLLIAIADVAGLLLARAAARRRESAIRAALGGGPWSLARRSSIEALVLAAPAAVIGLPLAAAVLRLLRAIGTAGIPRLDEASLDGRALLFHLLTSAAAGLLLGLVPLLQTARGDLGTALKEGGSASASRRESRMRRGLVVGQLALALVLLLGAGLTLRTLAHLLGTDLGFDRSGVLTFRLTLASQGPRPDPSWQVAYFRRALASLAGVPGVERASLVLLRPLSGPIGWDFSFTLEGQTPEQQASNPISDHQSVSPGYFDTLGIRRLRGRDFRWSDGPDAPLVAIVGRSMAERCWPGRDPIGRRFHWRRPGDPEPWITVIGVVDDVRYRDLGPPRPDIYVPFLQETHWAMDAVLRTREASPERLLPAVRSALAKLDPVVPIARPTTLDQALSDTVARPRLRAVVLAGFAALATLLSAVGLYGLIAYSVAQRRQEIGVRLALGAARGHVIRMVVRQGLVLALLGLAAGLAIAGLGVGAGWVDGLLQGIGPADLATLLAVVPLLLAVALLACLMPAMRATEVDPLSAMRHE
jgi:putative ABC transport system permease protein